jgi:hypothetical protein
MHSFTQDNSGYIASVTTLPSLAPVLVEYNTRVAGQQTRVAEGKED